jgi:hypothetical protein
VIQEVVFEFYLKLFRGILMKEVLLRQDNGMPEVTVSEKVAKKTFGVTKMQ